MPTRYRKREITGLIDLVTAFIPPAKGYLMGGYNSAGSASAVANIINYGTGTFAASTVSNLSVARYTKTGISDCAAYGYVSGGHTGAASALTDRIVFSTAVTSANTVSNLPETNAEAGGLSDGTTYGYAAGGITSVITLKINRITFSTGIYAANSAGNLSSARRSPSGLSSRGTYGYRSGGQSDGDVPMETAWRITFSTGTPEANTGSNLSLARRAHASISDQTTNGYWCGGYSSAMTAVTDRIVFSTSVTSANTVSNLGVVKGFGYGFSGGDYGYYAGGYSTAGFTITNVVDRMTFSTGVFATYTSTTISTALSDGCSFNDSAV